MVRSELKLKKILLGVALLGATSTAALAADLPSRRAPPVYIPPPVPVFTWTGFYIGGNAGYAFDAKSSFNTTAGAARTFVQSKADGFTGGGQIGYNFQLGNAPILGNLGGGFGGGGLILGVEADAAYTDLRRDFAIGGAPYNANTQFVGTARGRLGYAFNNVMIYGTGGFAYGGINDRVGVAVANKIATGYAYGGGIEYAIPTSSFVNFFHSSAVTLKAEYLHYDLGSQALNAGRVGSSVKNDGNIVRGGINYKFDLFGVPAAPVVARY
ncbi:Porin [Beijerinckiaceae bacterium RH AL1]|jgi:outer membrane immunogenic protein|nr:Porin [Beijerinckiaceae bacterium RH CH11]VVB49780.1 Porin [Beijerinckiaceae bacterium RH AL8]VVC57035.1 Porin [Beijerinckiaceae bacterium RH AL1]